MQAWPEYLPNIKQGSTDNYTGNVRSVEQIGRTSQALKQQKKITQASVSLVMRGYEFAIFEYFHAKRIGNGADKLTVKYFLLDGSLSDVTARIIDGDYTAIPVTPSIWNVEFNLEIFYEHVSA